MRGSIGWWTLGASLALGTLLPATAGHAQPEDVERVAGLDGTIGGLDEEALRSYSPPDSLQAAFAATLLGGVRDLARRKGIATEAQVDSQEFADFVGRAADRTLEQRWGTVRETGDAGALDSLARSASSDRGAERLLAGWLGVPRPADPEPRADDSTDPPRLSSQMSTGSRGTVRLRPDLSSVTAEIGGPGAGNGVVDAGEWVHLSLALENAGDSPLFSSSAWVHSDHECLFADQDTEHELAETAAGETAALETWLYLSRECPDEVSFRVQLRDTHRSRPAEIAVRLAPRTVLDARLAATLIDADVPGSSEAGDPALEAGRRIEIATDLELVRGQAHGATMVYALDESHLELMAAAEMREEPMHRRDARYFEAGDDLDIEAAGASHFSTGIARLQRDSRWFTGDERRIWIGTDTVLHATSPDPPDGAPRPPADTPDPALTPAHFDAVSALVLQHLRLVASPTPAELPGAVAAAEGYEVLFDRQGFLDGLSALAGPTAATADEPGTSRAAHVPYSFRHYLALEVHGPAVVEYVPPPRDPDPPDDPEPPRPERVEIPREPLHRTVFHMGPASVQWWRSGPGQLSNYAFTLGVATVDRPVGFYFVSGFQPVPAADTVIIPNRIGAQFNLNGIPGAADAVPWLNLVFQVGGVMDVMVGEEILLGVEIGPALDFFLSEHFSLGTGVTFGASRGLLDGGDYRHTRWEVLRLQFH